MDLPNEPLGRQVVPFRESEGGPEALTALTLRAVSHPELLQTASYRRRFTRLVRATLQTTLVTRADVWEAVDAGLACAGPALADSLQALMAASLAPAAPVEAAVAPLLQRLADCWEPAEAAEALLSAITEQFGPAIRGELQLACPELRTLARLPGGKDAAAPAFRIHWTDAERVLGTLELQGLDAEQQAAVRDWAPWLQPTVRRLTAASAAPPAPEEDAGRSLRLADLKVAFLGLNAKPQTIASYLKEAGATFRAAFAADSVRFWQAEENGGRWNVHRLTGEPPASLARKPVEALRQAAVAEGGVQLAALEREGGLATLALVPVAHEGRLEGVFEIVLPAVGVSASLAEELELAAELVGVGLHTVRFYEQLSYDASHDGLTGLANRRTFDQVLEREFRLARRHHAPLALLMIDLDRFKAFNDAHGHPAGDALLAALGGALRQGVRATDFLARYGGEEFVALLPHTDAAGAGLAAEKLLAAIRALSEAPAALGDRISASIGVAVWPGSADSPAALLDAADAALYRAKGEGRDRVATAGGYVSEEKLKAVE